mmetsp:Transcript_21861/g.52523  ORF Transcript_21861/g.52523 Transcript_21861/m.52523 type:complete len:228 (+) Transcript_21861:435-1118(+)
MGFRLRSTRSIEGLELGLPPSPIYPFVVSGEPFEELLIRSPRCIVHARLEQAIWKNLTHLRHSPLGRHIIRRRSSLGDRFKHSHFDELMQCRRHPRASSGRVRILSLERRLEQLQRAQSHGNLARAARRRPEVHPPVRRLEAARGRGRTHAHCHAPAVDGGVVVLPLGVERLPHRPHGVQRRVLEGLLEGRRGGLALRRLALRRPGGQRLGRRDGRRRAELLHSLHL